MPAASTSRPRSCRTGPRSRPISPRPPADCLRSAPSVSGRAGSSLEPAAFQAGLAYGLTGLMRALPVHAASGRVYLPADALLRHGTSPEAVLAGQVERRPSRRAGRAAAQGEASPRRSAPRMSPSSMPMRAPPSGRFAWLTLISLHWRKPGAIRCARSPGSIRSTGFGAWRAGADSERRRRCTSARSNPGGSAGFPTSAPPPRAFRSPSPSPRR